ncbi:hypothetical protein [Nostoc sp. PCC 7107]|uniref:hypothetical protein n=1 Tax=Nostoc sp. PCC 7107 TaxID=317936 RepID=UPI00029EE909|nr:hypothetical protein [Nostoc sp. PCC 7107]AFY45478.1 hypothetical protein Nos7107_4960 [Nostoc sp. PCC 7107]
MQVRLAAKVAAKVEGIRQLLHYQTLTDTVNLLLDAIKHQWDLKLTNLSQIETKDTRVRLDNRHLSWLSQYGEERGINIASVTNLLISEYLSGKLTQTETRQTTDREADRQQTEKPIHQPLGRQQTATEKPKGQALMRSLKL